MKTPAPKLIFILIITLASFPAYAQKKTSVHFLNQLRWESPLSYNFFTGPDAADFKTSVNGFGSGILDIPGMRTSLDIINLGTDNIYISMGAGFNVTKYRLAKNLVPGVPGDEPPTWTPDPDTTHNYVNTFFGYGKTKIITTSFYFPVNLNMAIGKGVMVTAGGYLDLNLTARYKMKYRVGEDQVKEIIRSDEFRQLNPSTTKLGLNITLYFKKIGYGLSGSYSLTPFFKPGSGPDIHEARISASYRLRNLHNLLKKKD